MRRSLPAAPTRSRSLQGHRWGCGSLRQPGLARPPGAVACETRLQRGPRTRPHHTHNVPRVLKPRVPKVSTAAGRLQRKRARSWPNQDPNMHSSQQPNSGDRHWTTHRARGPAAATSPAATPGAKQLSPESRWPLSRGDPKESQGCHGDGTDWSRNGPGGIPKLSE